MPALSCACAFNLQIRRSNPADAKVSPEGWNLAVKISPYMTEIKRSHSHSMEEPGVYTV